MQGRDALILVAAHDLSAGLARYPGFSAQVSHRFPVKPPGNKPKSLIDFRMLYGMNTSRQSEKCYPCVRNVSAPMSRPGALIVLDTVIRRGAVLDAGSANTAVQGVRKALAKIAGDPRLAASVLQTDGARGHEGLAVAVVVEAMAGQAFSRAPSPRKDRSWPVSPPSTTPPRC